MLPARRGVANIRGVFRRDCNFEQVKSVRMEDPAATCRPPPSALYGESSTKRIRPEAFSLAVLLVVLHNNSYCRNGSLHQTSQRALTGYSNTLEVFAAAMPNSNCEVGFVSESVGGDWHGWLVRK